MTDIRILVVDDHAVIRNGLSKVLMVNKDLVPVGEATDGSEAIEIVATHNSDVVLMDLMMPGMDGITCAGYLLIRPAFVDFWREFRQTMDLFHPQECI